MQPTVKLLGMVIDDKLTFSQRVKITNSAALKIKCSTKTVKMARPRGEPELWQDICPKELPAFPSHSVLFSQADMLAVECIQKQMLRMVYETMTLPVRIYYLKVI